MTHESKDKAERTEGATTGEDTSERRADADADDWLTTGEAARALDVDPRTVGRLVERGRLAAPVVIDGNKRFRRSEVQRVVFERRTQTSVAVDLDRHAEDYDAATAARVIRSLASGTRVEALATDGVHPRTVLAILRDNEAMQKVGAVEHPSAGALFAAFDANLHPVDIVKRTGLASDIVQTLYAKWAQLRGGFYLPGDQVREIAIAFGLCIGQLDDPKSFTYALKNGLLARQVECEKCNASPATLCAACARAQTISEASDRAERHRQYAPKDRYDADRHLNELRRSSVRKSASKGESGMDPEAVYTNILRDLGLSPEKR